MKIVLQGERPVSWNTFYSGRHWRVRKREADRVHLIVRNEISDVTTVIDGIVTIVVTVYFKNRPLDPCNIPAKIYIDGLLGIVIKDDSPKYVDSVTTKSRVDKDNPRVEIVINEVDVDYD